MRTTIIQQSVDLFRADLERVPSISLRGGDALDSYQLPAPYDPQLDAITDEYLATYAYHGLPFLDAASWRHYIPHLIAYTFRQLTDTSTMVIDGFLYSLRPPDREPPRLATLTPDQEALIVAFLEQLAFSDDTLYFHDDAMQILEEWWLPNARYRPTDT